VHKQLSEYTITEDNINLVAEGVQDHTTEDFEEAQHHRGRIQKEFTDIRQVLENKIGSAKAEKEEYIPSPQQHK
jgi:hypothetical protein